MQRGVSLKINYSSVDGCKELKSECIYFCATHTLAPLGALSAQIPSPAGALNTQIPTVSGRCNRGTPVTGGSWGLKFEAPWLSSGAVEGFPCGSGGLLARANEELGRSLSVAQTHSYSFSFHVLAHGRTLKHHECGEIDTEIQR